MTLPPPSSSSSFGWHLLPAELQQLVLSHLTESHLLETPNPDNETTQTHPLAAYACVSKSWQIHTEPTTFHHILLLSPDDIPTFSAMFQRLPHRRKYIKHIVLHVGIYIYKGSPGPPTALDRIYDANNDRRNDRRFAQAVRSLWDVLSSWDTHGAYGNEGVTLELGAESIDELDAPRFKQSNRHYAQYLGGGPYTVQDKCRVSILRKMKVLHNRHIEDEDFRAKPLNFPTVVIDDNAVMQQPEDLPPVQVITHVLVRLRYLPSLSAAALSQIFKGLVRLKSIHVEQWRRRKRDSNERWKEFAPDVLPNLTRLTLYEDSFLRPRRNARPPTSVELFKHILNTSRELKQLSISFLLDAHDVFRLPPFSIPNPEGTATHLSSLTSLALTSKALTSMASPQVNNLLRLLITKVMPRLPSLTLLELWHQRKAEAGIFRYKKKTTDCGDSGSSDSELTWLGTWEPEFEKDMLRMWQTMARRSKSGDYGRGLEISLRPLVLPQYGTSLAERIDLVRTNAPIRTERAVVVEQLKLKRLVVHEVSLLEQV